MSSVTHAGTRRSSWATGASADPNYFDGTNPAPVLDLGGAPGAPKLAPLGPAAAFRDATGLKALRLKGAQLADLYRVAGLHDLVWLDLTGNRVGDLSPLSDHRRLRVLRVGGNAVRDLWPLSHLASLRALDVSGNADADATPLHHLPALSVLDVSGNPVTDAGSLDHLPALERAGNGIGGGLLRPCF